MVLTFLVSVVSAVQTRGDGPLLPPAVDCADLPVQIMLDVDDTIKSSGGGSPNASAFQRLAGCDSNFIHGAMYPGAAQFVRALARKAEDRRKLLQPALMSARPEEFAEYAIKASDPAVLAMEDHGAVHAAGYPYQGFSPSEGVPSDHPYTINLNGSFYGSIFDIIEYNGSLASLRNMNLTLPQMVENFPRTKASKFPRFAAAKVRALQEYYGTHTTLWLPLPGQPSGQTSGATTLNTCVIFVGDDGQGDCAAAAGGMQNVTRADGQPGLQAAFVHRLPTKGCNSKLPCESSQSKAIRLFDTYLDAARLALEATLISENGYERVREAVTSYYAAWCEEQKAESPILPAGCEQLRRAILLSPPLPPSS